MGYISHLTADEAFRDVVTIRVHGIEDWRPIICGLWSYVDELPHRSPNLGGVLDRFDGRGQVGFIDRKTAALFLSRARGWAESADPFVHERVFLEMTGQAMSDADVKKRLAENRALAEGVFDARVKSRFVAEAPRTRTLMRSRNLSIGRMSKNRSLATILTGAAQGHRSYGLMSRFWGG